MTLSLSGFPDEMIWTKIHVSLAGTSFILDFHHPLVAGLWCSLDITEASGGTFRMPKQASDSGSKSLYEGRKSRQARHCHRPASARFSSITAFRANRKLLTNLFLFSFDKKRIGRRRPEQGFSIMDVMLELTTAPVSGCLRKMSNTSILDMLDLNIWLSLTSNFGIELRM